MNLTTKSTKLFVTAASFFALAASANASDLLDGLNDPAPTQAQVNWTGLWVGAVGGYQFAVTENLRTWDDGENEKTVGDLGSRGWFGEAQAGYDHQLNSNIVVGVFGGYNVTDAETEGTWWGGDYYTASFEQDWGAVVGGRLGLLKSRDTMFYAGGGWAFGEISGTFGESGEDPAASFDDNLSGWFAELGMETRVSGNVYLTVAGRYTDYGSVTFTDSDDLDLHPYDTIEIDTDSLAVMVGLKAKLGGF